MNSKSKTCWRCGGKVDYVEEWEGSHGRIVEGHWSAHSETDCFIFLSARISKLEKIIESEDIRGNC